jgi:hypothetical protein
VADRPNHSLAIGVDFGANSKVYTTPEIHALLSSLKKEARKAFPNPQLLWAMEPWESGRKWPVEEGILFVEGQSQGSDLQGAKMIRYYVENKVRTYRTRALSKARDEQVHRASLSVALEWLHSESITLSSGRWEIISLSPPDEEPEIFPHFWTPLDWETALDLAPSRTRSKKLRILGPENEQLGGVPHRTMVATVQGFSELLDHGTYYHFMNGRWISWFQQQNRTPLSGPVRSWIAYGKKTINFKTLSSFSLEGQGTSGVRESLICEHPLWSSPARLVIDWYFHDKAPGINVSFTLRMPKNLGPEKPLLLAPIELPLIKKKTGKKMLLHSYDKNEKTGTSEVSSKPASGLGTGFLMDNGQSQVYLTFPQEIMGGHYPLECRLGQAKHGRCLILFPGGLQIPSASKKWEGKEMHLRFGLHLVDIDAGPSPKELGEKPESCSLPYLLPW